jgi:hypothetical protein
MVLVDVIIAMGLENFVLGIADFAKCINFEFVMWVLLGAMILGALMRPEESKEV